MNWKILIAVVVLIALSILLALPAFHRWNAGRVNDIRQEYIIQNAQGRVASYEWFYDMQEQISATRKKAELAKGTTEERGIRMVLAGMIAEYNAKSRMKSTRAQWKAVDLPYQIEQ